MSASQALSPEGPTAKRLRDQDGKSLPTEVDSMETTGDESLTHKGDRRGEEHRLEPSPVVHVRALHRSIIEADLWDSLSVWGKIVNIFMMSQKHQALVEFERIESAMKLVKSAQKDVVNVRHYPTLFNYSKSQKIELPIRHNETDQRGDAKEHNIILFTIRKPMYPITVDVMHTICKQFGKVKKIVVFRKSVLQSMVEFEDIPSASAAMKELNGADIYSGCCTLKAEYAKQQSLNVVKNDSETWDFTSTGPDASRSKPLLAAPTAGPPRPFSSEEPYDLSGIPGQDYAIGAGYTAAGGVRDAYADRRGDYGAEYGADRGRYGHEYGAAPQGFGGAPRQGCVVIFHALNAEKMNCDRLFNLLCLYGNVERIKFLKTKEGAALVQMGDPVACERVINNLHGAHAFDSRMQVSFSKQMFLEDQNNPGDLKDGTCAFKDYHRNRNNRFSTPTSAAKNRIQAPCELVHFYNAPPGMIEEEILQIIEMEAGVRPLSCKIFLPKGAETVQKSTSGLLKFDARKTATDVVCLANHAFVVVPDKPQKEDGQPNGHIFKLCFSNSKE